MVESKTRPDDLNENSAPSTSAVASSQQNPAEEEKAPSSRRAAAKGVSATRDDELIINTSEQIEIVSSFDQLGIPEQLLRGKFAQESNRVF